MVITGAFLAEAAATVDNKLHVWGGVLEYVTVGPDRRFGVTLVVLTQSDSGTADRAVNVEIVPPTEDEPFTQPYEVPEYNVGAEIGFAYFRIGGALPFDGRYVFIVRSGEQTAILLPLTVSQAQ